MPHPGVPRPDLCSIRAADGQAEHAEAAGSGLTADGHPPAGDDPPAPPASGTDRAIHLSTAAAVLAVAGIAAYVSYWHADAVLRATARAGISRISACRPLAATRTAYLATASNLGALMVVTSALTSSTVEATPTGRN